MDERICICPKTARQEYEYVSKLACFDVPDCVQVLKKFEKQKGFLAKKLKKVQERIMGLQKKMMELENLIVCQPADQDVIISANKELENRKL